MTACILWLACFYFHKYLLRWDTLLGTYCVQLCARCCGAEEDRFSILEVLPAYWNRQFYVISLNPELCGLFCGSRGYSIDGEVRVDGQVIANPSWELTCTKHSANQPWPHSILTQFGQVAAIINSVLCTRKLWDREVKYLHHDGKRQAQEMCPGLWTWTWRACVFSAKTLERLGHRGCASLSFQPRASTLQPHWPPALTWAHHVASSLWGFISASDALAISA